MTYTDRVNSWAPRILGAFRIIAGVNFATYGAMKIFGAFGGIPPGMAPSWLIWTAGPIEFFGGVLLALGLFTRPAAFLSSGLMAAAYFYGHLWPNLGKPYGFFPIINQGAPALLYCWLWLYIWAQGPGAWALDNVIRRR
jgi:putative oxidoreductase